MADEIDTKDGTNSEIADKVAKADTSGSADTAETKPATDTSVKALATAPEVKPAPKRRGRPPKSAEAKLADAAAKSRAKTAKKMTIAAKPKASKPSKPTKPAKTVNNKSASTEAVKAPLAAAKTKTPAPKAASKAPAAARQTAKPIAVAQPIRKEPSIMDMSANFSTFQDSMAEAQAKAKEAFEKTTGMFGDASEFAKGNVEAMMESGKIFSEGVQEMSTTLAAEGKAAFETMSADMKELAAVKSPTDFFKLQSEMMRKNFDSAVAYGSKNSEAMLKLMSDSMAPLSGRVSMAVEKVRQASI
ncbi:phasin family protein [Novosphingobium aquimarinum]|uniref:phasin family protein n=1 Tax=Novosphingobium aquimarinum TaxID=2682494 RepID=UPI0012EC200B|nr:phasin family protein [Novosphingobium aquimarinum]